MQSGSEKKAVVFYCALMTGFFLSMSACARGDFVRIDLYGQVTSVIDPAGLLGGQVSFLDEITGFYIFDTSTPDGKPLDSNQGEYQQTSPGCGISLNINGILFASNPQNMNLLIKVINDTDSMDSYLLSSTVNLPTAGGLAVSSIHWQLEDSTCTALSSDALVGAVPQQWGPNVLDITFRDAGGAGRIKGFITYTEAVPEPASAMILSLGFLFIGRRRRSKKSNIKNQI